MPHELTPEQEVQLAVALSNPTLPPKNAMLVYGGDVDRLTPVVAQLLADERERIAQEIEADVDRMRRAGGGIFTADFIEGTRYAARIARGQA